MHIFISGVGAGTGPLAVLAHQAGFSVSASDKQDNEYVEYVRKQGVDVHIGQSKESIAAVHAQKPIDWLVHSSAVTRENMDHPELLFAAESDIRVSKRDEFIQHFLEVTDQKMVAIAGTHGKSTTTAMAVWLCQQIGLPVSYLVGAKMPFADAGHYDKNAEYFVYEADEYDRNFLSFSPFMSLISGIGYDHPDIYPTQDDYNQAFQQFIGQSEWTIAHQADLQRLKIDQDRQIFAPDSKLDDAFTLIGQVNRDNAKLVVQGVSELAKQPYDKLVDRMNQFPGLSRRFEQIVTNVYSDYAHTPEKIQGAIQIAREFIEVNMANEAKLAIVYEGLHNTRQHFIKDELPTLFAEADKLYIVPSYRAREDESLEDLTPEKLCQLIADPADSQPMQLDQNLNDTIQAHAATGGLVLCLSAGGGNSLDEWLRATFKR